MGQLQRALQGNGERRPRILVGGRKTRDRVGIVRVGLAQWPRRHAARQRHVAVNKELKQVV